MKKVYFMSAALAAMLAMAGCSNEDLGDITGNGENTELGLNEDIIEIAVSNTDAKTRAARPMGSSAASNTVNNIELKFYSYNNGTSKWEPATGVSASEVDPSPTYSVNSNVITWTDNPDEKPNGEDGVNIDETVKVKLSNLQPNTQYRIVAYGYNGTKPYGEWTDATNGLLQTGDHSLSGYDLEEVFAGYVEKSTQASGKFTTAPVVTLTRQVAGMLAYFKIPSNIEGEKVEKVVVKANRKSEGFKFPASLIEPETTFNGIEGTGATDGEELITFIMSECAENYKNIYDENKKVFNSEYYTTGTTGKGYADEYTAPTGLELAENAFFGARFVLPYAEQGADDTTLTVIIYGEGDDELKTIDVVEGTDKDFGIACNNFYSLGQKLYSDNTEGDPDGDGPEQPDDEEDDKDDPIDLGTTDKIIVRINDAWDTVHKLEIE